MKKLLIAAVLGLTVMFAAGSQVASAAVWRGGNRGHVTAHPSYRMVYNHHTYATRPYFYGHNYGFYDRCW